ncbi:MAG: TrkA family potassium uptake protein [Lachnospiraceae bacterium]|nr:TrkA family potassium uptake protein [Lachnospiraceae bacterium]
MKSILLVGLGRFGRNVAIKLNELNNEVMAVDKVEERVVAVLPFVTNAQIGDSTNADFMKTLGVENYDVCIVAIGNDFQSSLETTALLSELGAKRVISRAARDVQAKFLARNGADHVVYPEKQMAEWTAIRYTSDKIFDYAEVEDGCDIIEVAVPEKWLNKTLAEIDMRKKYKLSLLGTKKNGRVNIDVGPATVLTDDITILVVGSYRDIRHCFDL